MKLIGLAVIVACGLAACSAGDDCRPPARPKERSTASLSASERAQAQENRRQAVAAHADAQAATDPLSKLQSSYGGDPLSTDPLTVYAAKLSGWDSDEYCAENAAFKARYLSDSISEVAKAITTECNVDEDAAVKRVFEYRVCASHSACHRG